MVQKSLSRMVELKLKGCWYKLSLCCEYLIQLRSICTIIVCVCVDRKAHMTAYSCLFGGFVLVCAIIVMCFCLCLQFRNVNRHVIQ